MKTSLFARPGSGRVFALVLAALLAVFSAGCASLKPEAPEVSIDAVRLLEMGFAEQRFAIRLRVRNPNNREFVLNKLDYVLELSGSPFARGQLDRAVRLPARGETVIEVPANMRLRDFLNSAAGKLLSGAGPSGRGQLDYRLIGTAQVDDAWNAPFERRGTISLFKNDQWPQR